MLPRALVLLPLLGLACSPSSQGETHGLVIDASGDMAMDDLPDAAPDGANATDATKEGGHAADAGGQEAGDAKSVDGPVADGAKKGDGGSCKGTLALAGGSGSVAFGATSVDGGAWNFTSLTSSATYNPALVSFGGGFVGVFTTTTTDYLQYSAYASSTWSPAANATGSSCIGPAAALGSSGLAAIGTTLHTVYLGTDNKFYHGTFAASTWDCEGDPLTPSGGSQSFGPSAPGLAAVGSSLVAAFDGNDHGLYTQSWTASAWDAAQAIPGAGVGMTPPTLVALTGGASDLLVVFSDTGDDVLYWATRTAGVWSTAAVTNATAISTSPVSIAPTSGGGAVLVFQGTDSNPYAMTFDATASTPWSTPVAIVTGNLPLGTPPTVAPGICGADAIAEIVQPAGVEVFRLTSGTWSAPTLVSEAVSMTYATIATSP